MQGMNFIAGALLYHCSEECAFWLFVSLIEDYEMRDIYEPGLPGLYKHSQMIDLLVMEYKQDLFRHFVRFLFLIKVSTKSHGRNVCIRLGFRTILKYCAIRMNGNRKI